MKRIKYCLLLSLLAFQFAGCDDTYYSSVPDYYVNLQLNLTSTYPTFRNNPYKYLVFEKRINVTDGVGYGGILVFCGVESYYAYDLSCPHEHKQTILVRPNDIGQAVCDSCKTVYDVSYGFGNPVSGPSKEALKRYKANLSGDILYITR